MPLKNRQFARQVYGRVAIDISESIIGSGHAIPRLGNLYYKETKKIGRLMLRAIHYFLVFLE